MILALAHPLLNPQARACRRRAAAAGHRRRLGGGARLDPRGRPPRPILLAEAEREDRQVDPRHDRAARRRASRCRRSPRSAPADARAAVQALQPKPWPADRKAALARLAGDDAAAGHRERLAQRRGRAHPAAQIDRRIARAIVAAARRAGTLRYVAADEVDAPRLLLPESPPASRARQGIRRRRAVAAGARCRARSTVRASGEDGRAARRARPATIGPGESRPRCGCRCRPSCATGSPGSSSRARNRPARVLLIDERWRRRPVGIAAAPNTAGQPLLSEDYYLERALAPFTEVRRGRARRPAEARARRADLFRCRPEFAGARRPRSRDWIEKGGVLLRFAGPHLAEHGDKLLPVRLRRRRPHDRRRAVLGAAGQARAVRAGEPVRRAGGAGRRDGDAPGAGRARPRPGQQDLGAAGRRHAAGDRREARQGLDRAGAHHRQYRMVEPGAVRAVRRDAAAGRRNEPGRDGGDRATRCRRSRRSTGSAGCSARRRHGAADIGRRDRDRDAVAAPPARFLRRRRLAARAEPVGRDHRAEADRRRCPAGVARAPLRPEERRGRFAPAAADRRLPAGADRPADRLCAARAVAPPRRAGRDSREPAGRDAAGPRPRRRPTTRLSCAPPPSCASPMCAPAIARSTRSAAPG